MRKRFVRYALGSGLIGCIAVGVWVGSHLLRQRYPDAFTLDKIVYDQTTEFPNSDCPVDLLKQKFSYVGHGTQMIAFEGEDKKTVLKLFLQKSVSGKKRYRMKSFRDWVPALRREKEKKKKRLKEEDLCATFQHYAKAFEVLKEETGLIGIHLSATHGQFPTCIVEDFDRNEWVCDLDRASFILQVKATPVREVFPRLKTIEEKHDFFQAMDSLLEQRARKGFKDLGQGRFFDGNYGFIGNKAILLDAGHIGYSEEIQHHPDLEIEKMKQRLRERYL